jgi:hypothetical protein
MGTLEGKTLIFAFELAPNKRSFFDVYDWFVPGTLSLALLADTEDDAETIACAGYRGIDTQGVGIRWRFKRRGR